MIRFDPPTGQRATALLRPKYQSTVAVIGAAPQPATEIGHGPEYVELEPS